MTINSSLPAKPIAVIAVDDHPFFLEGITTWITRQKDLNFCGAADSVEGALSLIAAVKPELMLLDLQLRDGDGLELLRRISTIPSPPLVIVLSHKDQTVFAERALNAGAKGYVLKNEGSDVMLTAIHTVLRGGIHLSPEMNRRLYKDNEIATRAPADKMRTLYNREVQVLELLGRGHTTKEIADAFGISGKTVDSYRESLKKKLEVPDSVTLIRLATIWQETGCWGAPAKSPPEQPAHTSRSPLRPVVVVDDSNDDIALVRRSLMSSGLANPILSFNDSEKAQAYLTSICAPADGEPLPSVVFTDLKMPRVNGCELVASARADRRFDAVRFVVLSSSENPADEHASKAAGADGYLIKIPEPAVLARIVTLANAEQPQAS